ncbi:group III truncated hemoglobin [Parasphingopyxis lamellibrachiae]|uniref:Hemoglobin n=1 Tax=Parasphingopyxis lamellibrachiae TaxID=680125 RepID=A0A3D9FDU9_9SPHN|nr:group III truncated hemoglobin [Parasphingopyxis lamellibrachiae]RED16004.1 hemoglobin [Parasphingopyxis lamellibrachiae]
MGTTTEYAISARRDKAEHAARIGIDDALISTLVESFYAAIRRDPLLGPIFESKIADWPAHLSRMKDFWASIALESGRFHGNPMVKHIAIGTLERHHFEAWLNLFSATLDAVVPGEAARMFFQERAARIAESLLMGIEVQRSGLKDMSSQLVGETNRVDG